jgi:hypothetical protein
VRLRRGADDPGRGPNHERHEERDAKPERAQGEIQTGEDFYMGRHARSLDKLSAETCRPGRHYRRSLDLPEGLWSARRRLSLRSLPR